MKTSYKVIEYRLYEGLVQIQGMLNLLKFDEALSNAVVEVKELIKSKKYKIAVMGEFKRGKSSLINALCNRKKLCKTSSTPGKTRLINVFLINGTFHLVDLPGYGFAKVQKTEQARWGAMMEITSSTARCLRTCCCWWTSATTPPRTM